MTLTLSPLRGSVMFVTHGLGTWKAERARRLLARDNNLSYTEFQASRGLSTQKPTKQNRKEEKRESSILCCTYQRLGV